MITTSCTFASAQAGCGTAITGPGPSPSRRPLWDIDSEATKRHIPQALPFEHHSGEATSQAGRLADIAYGEPTVTARTQARPVEAAFQGRCLNEMCEWPLWLRWCWSHAI